MEFLLQTHSSTVHKIRLTTDVIMSHTIKHVIKYKNADFQVLNIKLLDLVTFAD